jgi:hypothetical protein
MCSGCTTTAAVGYVLVAGELGPRSPTGSAHTGSIAAATTGGSGNVAQADLHVHDVHKVLAGESRGQQVGNQLAFALEVTLLQGNRLSRWVLEVVAKVPASQAQVAAYK